MSAPVEFRRTWRADGAVELLALVRYVDGEAHFSEALGYESPVVVHVRDGRGSFGLFDLDGERLPDRPVEWEVVTDAPAAVVAAVEEGWANGNCTVERVN